ncbi:hypothetical protein, partial [Streptomyces sp. NPDC007070]|uniref:hypothetical protein n=1 Tax=Streptomyces sp. NPDC007070 TaxID=3154312 RepID=UPI0033E2BF1D
LGPRDRFFWYTSTGWMMWNFLVSGLLTGTTISRTPTPVCTDLAGLARDPRFAPVLARAPWEFV